jgi:carboxylesterase type B
MEKSIMSPLSRREFITRVPLAAAGAMALGHARYSYSQTADVIVESAHGKLRGLRENGVNIFKGIPYAGRVSGSRRFLAPAPLEPWLGIRDALRLGLLGYLYLDEVAGGEYAFGSGHAMDIQFKFANVVQPPPGELEKGWPGNRPERFAAMCNMAGMWTAFARTGVPGAAGQPEWPPYTLSDRATCRIDSTCEVLLDRFREEREMWAGMG